MIENFEKAKEEKLNQNKRITNIIKESRKDKIKESLIRDESLNLVFVHQAKDIIIKEINKQNTKEDLLKCLKYAYCFIDLNLSENSF